MNRALIYLPILIVSICFSLILLKSMPKDSGHIPAYNLVSQSAESPLSLPDFKDVSWQSGVVSSHRHTSKHLSSAIESLGGGVCVIDINNDHWMDLFIVGGRGTTREYGREAWWHSSNGDRLLLNRFGNSFEDITVSAGITTQWSGMGCAVADMDNNGLDDLLVSGIGGQLLYRNLGANKFESVLPGALQSAERWSTHSALTDLDKDGKVDLYSTQFVFYQKGGKTFEASQGFVALRQVDFAPELYDPQPNLLFKNLGNMKFEPAQVAPDMQNNLGRSLGARWHDFNQDSLLDLLVINGFGSPNRVFINRAQGGFIEQPHYLRGAQVAGAHNVLIADLNRDNTGEMFIISASGLRNTFLESGSDGQFKDVAEQRHLAKKDALHFDDWGSVAADFNNDGYQDIYVGSGKILPDGDSTFIPKAQHNRIYINKAGQGFVRASGDDAHVLSGSTRGVISFDMDNDGVLEVLVANNNGPMQLLKNTTANQHKWVGVGFENIVPWLGGKVTVTTDSDQWQQSITFKQGLFSQNDPRIHFGLGEQRAPVTLTLEDSQGKSVKFTQLDVGSYYHLDQQKNLHAVTSHKVLSDLQKHLANATQKEHLAWFNLLLRPDEDYIKELHSLWELATPEDKLAVLEMVTHRNDKKALGLLFAGMTDQDRLVQLKAMEGVRLKEMESSVPWLLPLFASNSPEVVCKAAQMFAFFYEQEEAVLHRKALAVSPMMKALKKPHVEQQLCLLDALAASENKRAVEGVIKALRTSPSAEVRASAIRALGQVRDVKGVAEVLLALQKQPQAIEVAESLIALSRLRYDKLEQLFGSFFLTQQNRGIQLQRLLALLNRQEDIVLPKKWINQAVEFQVEILQAPERNPELIAWLKMLGKDAARQYFEQLGDYLNHPNSEIVVQAYASALQIMDKNKKADIESRLLAMDEGLRGQVILRSGDDFRFSPKILEEFVQKTLKSAVTADSFLTFLSALSKADQSSMTTLVLNSEPNFLSEAVTEFAEQQCIQPANLNVEHLRKFPSPLKLAVINWFYGCGTVEEQGLELVHWRVMLNEVLTTDQVSESDKVDLISRASLASAFVANQWLPSVVDQLETSEVVRIIANLPQNDRQDSLQSYLEKVSEGEGLLAGDKLYAYSLRTDSQIATLMKEVED